jgi:hypothetical protein
MNLAQALKQKLSRSSHSSQRGLTSIVGPGYNPTVRNGGSHSYSCAADPRSLNEVKYQMARRKTNRRDWRVIVFIIISLIIVLSMVLAYLPAFMGGPY